MKCERCNRPARTHGLCATHYQRERRGADLDAPLQPRGTVRISLRLPAPMLAGLRRAAPHGLPSLLREILTAWLARRR